ncbi:hypothetical protein IWX49DRAFT_16471 [Phyllosticta citricarpa]|uniref:AB hydrolase-1 domain-containing protein n=1 Tax=Phyllosticta paracitricarpa TaxID=2016321 RepID=A0ABR1NBD6_9PEZI
MNGHPLNPPSPTRHRRDKHRSVPNSSARRSSNRPRQNPGSPELISSLIDSLSAISTPVEDHFESLPRIGADIFATEPVAANPGTRSLTRFSNGGGRGSGFGVEYGVHRNERWEDEKSNQLIDEAAEPPVIKTAPPPSGFSAISAPHRSRREKESSLKNYIVAKSKSSSSLKSRRSSLSLRDDSSSISSSIQRGLRRYSTNSRLSIDSKNSRSQSVGHAGDRVRSRDSERKGSHHHHNNNNNNNNNNMTSIRSSGSIRSPGLDRMSTSAPSSMPPSPGGSPQFQRSLQGSRIDEVPFEEPVTPHTTIRVRPSSLSLPPSTIANEDGRRSPWIEQSIPLRNSSYRHSASTTPEPSRSASKTRVRNESKSPVVIHEDEEPSSEKREPKGKGRENDEEGDEAAQVTKRIKELKKQKELREQAELSSLADSSQESDKSIDDPQATRKAAMSPISRVLDLEERPRQENLAKAHRMLGLISSEGPPAAVNRSLPSSPTALEHSTVRNESSHGDEDAELRQNYQMALDALDRAGAETPSIGRSRSVLERLNSSTTTNTTKDRNKRSLDEAARRLDIPIQFSQTTSTSSRDYFSSPPSGADSLSVFRAPSRAASAEESAGVRDSVAALAPGPIKRSNSGSYAKSKRWSHPDIPLKLEQKHNEKADKTRRDQMPVKSPLKGPQVPEAVLEEPLRPASGDSIDDDVEAFLHSPRLTQKVREPTSGRTICFSEVGDPDGFAVLVCVGMGLTRYITAFYDELAKTLKLRLITPDRPGVGESQADSNGTPLSWPDDVLCICDALKITKFSIMAHSAGAIYALATALRMPQHIRGRVHLLAPWIPPSQMSAVGLPLHSTSPERQLPRSQRFLRVLPTPLLKVANSSFMSATSGSITRSVPKSPQRTKRKNNGARDAPVPSARTSYAKGNRESMMLMDQVLPNGSALNIAAMNPDDPNHEVAAQAKAAMTAAEQERRRMFDTRLTMAVWELATTNANPAVDLLVCLERTQAIGFRYVDITRAVVIHHGSRDTRVPVDNVKWLGRTMKKCEVRILEDEGHGLMASAIVMGNVLTEIAREWEDWNAVVKNTRSRDNLRGDALNGS